MPRFRIASNRFALSQHKVTQRTDNRNLADYYRRKGCDCLRPKPIRTSNLSLDSEMSSFIHSSRRGLLVVFAMLALSAFSIRPAMGQPYDYTDFWWVPADNGWGVNFTQSNDFLFAALFIYGPGQPGQPTWYTAHMTWDGTKFTGPLYASTGTYFASPWNPQNSSTTQVGTATFMPSSQNNYTGTFTYTVNGVGTFPKLVTRFTIKPVLIAANYAGGQSGSYSSCNPSTSNRDYQDFFTAEVTQNGANVAMTFTYTGGQNQLTCTLSGTTIQNGSILRIPNARYQCSDGVDTTASVTDLRATPLGFEGQFSAANLGPGGDSCSETARFGGVLNN